MARRCSLLIWPVVSLCCEGGDGSVRFWSASPRSSDPVISFHPPCMGASPPYVCALSSLCACLHTVGSVCGHVVFKCFSEIRPSFWCGGRGVEVEGSENIVNRSIPSSSLCLLFFFLHLSYLNSFFISTQQLSHFSLWVFCSRGGKLQCTCKLWESSCVGLLAWECWSTSSPSSIPALAHQNRERKRVGHKLHWEFPWTESSSGPPLACLLQKMRKK